MPTADNSPLHRVRHSPPDSATTLSRTLPRARAIGKDVWFYAGLIVVALAVLYASVFKGLWELWMTRQDYSHGFLVPLVSLYLIKIKWEKLKHCPIKPIPVLGLGLVLLALAGFFVGVAGGVITVSSLSFIGILTGLTLLLFGYPHLQALALPFAYLIFMTPVLDVVVDPVHHPLQLLAAKVVSALFPIAGVPTYLDGTFIHFPNGVLEVAIQCSGASFLISILAIGLPLASLALRTWWSRVALILAALVISIMANWARVSLIGMIGYLWGWGPQVHGPLHILQGMLVYWVGFGALFTGAWILAKVEQRRMNPTGRPAMIGPTSEPAPAWHTWRRVWRLALATLAVAIVYLYAYDQGPVAAKQSFASFPLTVGQWVVVETEQASPVVKLPGADQDLMRVYRKADGSTMRLYVAYLSSQTQGRELVNYLTAPLHQEAIEAAITVDGKSLPINIGFSEQHRTKTPILFWYAIHGRSIADRYQAKAATIVHALMHQGSHGALVLISRESKRGDQEIAVDDMEQFAQDLVPVLRPYLP